MSESLSPTQPPADPEVKRRRVQVDLVRELMGNALTRLQPGMTDEAVMLLLAEVSMRRLVSRRVTKPGAQIRAVTQAALAELQFELASLLEDRP